MNTKSLAAFVLAAVIAAPVIAAPTFADSATPSSNGPAAVAAQPDALSRAQVRAQLVQIEKAGYNPARGEDIHYPDDIQAAEAKVAAQNAVTRSNPTVAGTASASGAPAMVAASGNDGMTSIYSHH
ncbi:DUF4148 domain-containing protein [Pararobbsia alpina]|uniref:DUF4148 domain-containing protein n=1 Tax=Pararobbsia alpina TaxID=621374 RepID=A0A6S7BDZ5_9BURK|nr:DUF4148 domain-containing protein [Pararobbsia alpina]CAB3797112.1 hypothetical protein LMG28138_04191 [Pararobbsia alpina]